MKCLFEDKVTKTEVISKALNRYTKAKKDTEEVKYIEKLIFEDVVRTIRGCDNVWNYRIPSIKSAIQETDKTKKKERANVSYIEHAIKEDFLNGIPDCDIKVFSIVTCGYEDYAYQLWFKFKQGKKLLPTEYLIEIPNRKALTTGNFDYARGTFAFGKRTSECSMEITYMAWEEEELAKQITEYFKENEM